MLNNNSDLASFSHNLFILRESCGLTQKELGHSLGLAESTICQYENGKREPDINTLVALAKFFCVSLDYLLIGNQKEKDSCIKSEVLEEDIKSALFGANCNVTADMWQEVKLFVDFLKSKNC